MEWSVQWYSAVQWKRLHRATETEQELFQGPYWALDAQNEIPKS